MIPFFDDDLLKIPESIPFLRLSETVLLPGELLPIHIFEEYHKKIAESAISSEKLIAIAQVKPGWEKDYEGNPEIYEVAGLGKIVMEEQLPDGRFNLVLLGLKRVKIKQILQELPYQRAEVEILQDYFSQTSSNLLSSLESEIIELSQQLLKLKTDEDSFNEGALSLLEKIPADTLPLSSLCDLVAASFGLSPMEKQMILEETNVINRAGKLIFALRFQLQSYSGNLSNPTSSLH